MCKSTKKNTRIELTKPFLQAKIKLITLDGEFQENMEGTRIYGLTDSGPGRIDPERRY